MSETIVWLLLMNVLFLVSVLVIPGNRHHDEDVAHGAEQGDDAVQHEEGDLHLGQEDQQLLGARAGVLQGDRAVHVLLK